MKVGIFLSYIGLGSNLLHLSYCHEIAKKYGPVSVVTICKNFKEVVSDDPLIKEVIYINKYYKKIFDIFHLSKILKIHNFDTFFIFYPSIRFFLASKIAGIKNIYTYPFFKKKNLHLVNTAQKFILKTLKVSFCPTETKIFISETNKKLAKEKINKNKKNIVIGAGSSGPFTKWGEKNYINLIKKLNKNNNFYFYILCGPDENKISEKIINSIGDKNSLSLSEKKIRDLIPIISQCDLYIGNDSFGHHVTSQCGIPSIILLLDTPSAYTEYSRNQYRIVPKNINIKSINHDSRIDPDEIKVDQVYEKALSLIN
tara:strand:- start:1899 stop:2837 length:939 start_codon:yes stop_codon:yes gene_type:complete